MRKLWKRVRDFSVFERRLLLAGLVLTIIGLSALGVRSWRKATTSVPVAGGKIVEGFLGSKTELTQTIDRLTRAGLVFKDSSGNFQPLLADSWEIQDGGRKYTFSLRSEVSASGIVAVAKERSDLFDTVNAEAPDDQTVVFSLKQPYGPFLSILSLPLFAGGPFQIGEQTPEQIVFSRNESFANGPAYLEQITIKMFSKEEELAKAASRGDVTAAAPKVTSGAKFTSFAVSMPRRYVIFFNTAEGPFLDKSIREKILAREGIESGPKVVLTTSAANKSRGETIVKKWQEIGLDASLAIFDESTMKKSVIPERNYQALLYGLDVGVDPDPYRFWHSSQAKQGGLNLTNLKDAELDLLLEDARRTIDEEGRTQKYEEIERKIQESATMIVLEEITFSFQVDRRVKGIQNLSGVDIGSRYNGVWDWYIKEKRVFR